MLPGNYDVSRLLTYGGILFLLSVFYFLFVTLQVLIFLDIINFSDISLYIIPVLLLNLPVGIPLFFLMFKELGVLEVRELLIVTMLLSVIAAIIGFLYLHLGVMMIIEEDPAEYMSYEGSDIFQYLDPFHKNECEYGILPREYMDSYDECLNLTSMALAVRYYIYLGPHNPITLFIGGYVLRRLMQMVF